MKLRASTVLFAALTLLAAVACEPSRRTPEQPTEGEREGAEGEGEGEGARGEGEGEGEGSPAEGEGEGTPGEGEGEGSGEGEGEGEDTPDAGPLPDVDLLCQSNNDCEDDEICNVITGDCISDEGCTPCDARNICQRVNDQPHSCELRFGDSGCCIPSCFDDVHCAGDEYCNAGAARCDPGCRVGGCIEGQICDEDARECRDGCRDSAGCPDPLHICDLGTQVCIVGCLDDDGCAQGQRCDTDVRQCTDGCIVDADCAERLVCHRERHRCTSRCDRAPECLEGQLCDEELGGCVVDPEACFLDDACPQDAPEGATCDTFTGRCRLLVDPPACASDANCGDGDVCLPNGEAFACGPVVGEGGPNTPCEADADCRSGICLNDGTCYGACAEHHDCGEGLRCWTARFLAGLGDDPLDPASDPVVDVAACRAPPAPCLRSDDCEAADEECLPWRDPDSGEIARACRFADVGQGPPGSRCQGDLDCRSGVCTDDGFCLQTCVDDNDCGVLLVCGEVDVEDDGVAGTLPACVPDPGSGDPCTRDGDCPRDEFCRPEAGDRDDDLVLRCRPGRGGDALERCEHPWECASGHCAPGGYCFAACANNADCLGLRCGERPAGVPGREEAVVRSCPNPFVACERDVDCLLPGHVCTPAADPDDPSAMSPRCDEAVGNGGPGEACVRPGECASGVCLDEPARVCWSACTDDDDCPDDQRCYEDIVSVEMPGGFDGIPGCLPEMGSLDNCDRDGDCGDGEVCSAFANSQRDRIRTRCTLPHGGQGLDCEAFGGGACRSGICYTPNPLLPLSVCLHVCERDDDCPAFIVPLTCAARPLVVNGVEDNVNACAFF